MAGGVHLMVPEYRTNKYIEMDVRNIVLTKMSEIFDGLQLAESIFGRKCMIRRWLSGRAVGRCMAPPSRRVLP